MGELKISLTPTSITKYYTIGDAERFRKSLEPKQLKLKKVKSSLEKANEAKKKNNPELSFRSRKRIRNAVNWLSLLSAPRVSKYQKTKVKSNFRIGFWTLTLPCKQMHDHSEIKSKCLNNFLTVMRQKHNMHNYIWVAELQANGNIHFHITTDIYVHYREIRKIWNQSIELLGYISEYSKVFAGMSFKDYKYWRNQNSSAGKKSIGLAYNHGQVTEWKDPNTTDVKSVRHVKELASYLSKYLSKGNEDESKTGIYADSLRSFTGRRWFLSQSLSKLGTVKIDCTMRVRAIFDKFNSLKDAFRVERDFIQMVFFKIGTIPKLLKEFLRQELVSHAIRSGYNFQGDFNLILR